VAASSIWRVRRVVSCRYCQIAPSFSTRTGYRQVFSWVCDDLMLLLVLLLMVCLGSKHVPFPLSPHHLIHTRTCAGGGGGGGSDVAALLARLLLASRKWRRGTKSCSSPRMAAAVLGGKEGPSRRRRRAACLASAAGKCRSPLWERDDDGGGNIFLLVGRASFACVCVCSVCVSDRSALLS